MEEFIVQGSLGLTRGSLLRIEDGRDMLVYVWEGEIWLTEEGERRDRVLGAGEWHRLERRGAAIGYALRRSVLTLTAPQPEYYAERIVLVKAGSAAPVGYTDRVRCRIPGRARLRLVVGGRVRAALRPPPRAVARRATRAAACSPAQSARLSNERARAASSPGPVNRAPRRGARSRRLRAL